MEANSQSILKRLISTYSYISLEAKRYQRSFVGIAIEILSLYVKNGIGPNYYILAGMADKGMSWQDKCQHLSHANYHKAVDILNPVPYRKVTQHKLEEKSLLTLANIPTANFIGFYHMYGGFDNNGYALTNHSELTKLLLNYQGQKICAKLPEGSGGAGFFAGKIQEKTTGNSEVLIKALSGKSEKTLEQLLNEYAKLLATEGVLFESYIEQCPEYKKFNPTSVNTVRIWVLQTKESINVIGAYFRVGRQGSLTDNGDGGGIMCPVDILTGKLSKGLLTSTPLRDELIQHCDTDVQLEGVILSRWQEVISCSCDTLRKLPYTLFAGLDICMTNEGPVVIEVNVQPDKDGAAYAKIPSYLLSQAASEVTKSIL